MHGRGAGGNALVTATALLLGPPVPGTAGRFELYVDGRDGVMALCPAGAGRGVGQGRHFLEGGGASDRYRCGFWSARARSRGRSHVTRSIIFLVGKRFGDAPMQPRVHTARVHEDKKIYRVGVPRSIAICHTRINH